MFYKFIAKKRDEWFASPNCSVRDVIDYIEKKGKMRDAQVEAIKTFLYLKIVCGNRPLKQLFLQGFFNTLDIREELLNDVARNKFLSDKAAAALYEYSKLQHRNGDQISYKLEEYIKTHAELIDYEYIASKIFYDVDYADYLYSLPMGAGKTYLMAAFIYLDLYFAQNDMQNPVFAHNFMIFAPSGLKNSILPSLKNIMRFDPTWIFPEEVAKQLKRQIKFEVLDEAGSAKGSNIIRNPNAQKINTHLLAGDTFGLVAITNAEKVIPDHAENDQFNDADLRLFEEDEVERIKIKKGRELRRVIGNIPHLAIYVDEVHHVADGNIKLRQVISQWTESHSFKYMLGFSGTPFLETADKILVSEDLEIRNQNLSNVVCHYALVDAVGNFLKNPIVKSENADMATIIDNGVREFLNTYKDTIYENGTCAKQAIYCPNIKILEEEVYPQVANIVSEYGFAPNTAILRFYSDSRSKYKLPKEAQMEFDSLDSSLSRIRIILLVEIGKEGWDCRSLTSVVLPMKGSCTQNKVMQTSCRCLREVDSSNESALIWLNNHNAKILNDQLKKFQETNIEELNQKRMKQIVTIHRYSRMECVKLPKIEYMQLCVTHKTKNMEPPTRQMLLDDSLLIKRNLRYIHTSEGFRQEVSSSTHAYENTENADFLAWLYEIERESFRTLTVPQLQQYEQELHRIFLNITINVGGCQLFNNEYNQQKIRSRIRQAFAPICEDETEETLELREARLICVEAEKKLEQEFEVSVNSIYYPNEEKVRFILEEDQQNANIDKTISENPQLKSVLENVKANSHPERKFTYHYLPYHFDSTLERDYFAKQLMSLLMGEVRDKQLEVYFNGDDTISGFGIECYKQVRGSWQRIQKYYPDFLVLQRGDDNTARRVLIIETKGKIYEDSFRDKETFMHKFIADNSGRFEFLYLRQSQVTKDNPDYLLDETIKKIKDYFKD